MHVLPRGEYSDRLVGLFLLGGEHNEINRQNINSFY